MMYKEIKGEGGGGENKFRLGGDMVKEIPDSHSAVPCLLSRPSLADVSRYFNQRQVPVAAGHSGGENSRCSVPGRTQGALSERLVYPAGKVGGQAECIQVPRVTHSCL